MEIKSSKRDLRISIVFRSEHEKLIGAVQIKIIGKKLTIFLYYTFLNQYRNLSRS